MKRIKLSGDKQALIHALARLGFRQAEIARRCNVSHTTVARYLMGAA